MASTDRDPLHDVVIVGGGPAGLSAALAFGRARKRVLLCDAGPPRNAAAEEIHNFVTRDGTPPTDFRRTARAQLAPYESVEVRDVRVESIRGSKGDFEVVLPSGAVRARRVLLAVGMIDELPDLPGFRELWGKAIFQCPYCHGWEVRDRAFGCLVPSPQWLDWAIFLRGWTHDLVVLTDARCELDEAARDRLARAGIRLEERRIRRLVSDGSHLEAVELEDGERLPRSVLFARPPQRQTDVVRGLDLELDEQGFVKTGEQLETSRPGVYAAGDLTTMAQSAIFAAAAGVRAAASINHELTLELLTNGELP